MLINRDELSRKVLEGEITSLDDLNAVLRSMIKDVVETAMGAEMTGFLGYDRYQTPESDPGNRRNGYSVIDRRYMQVEAMAELNTQTNEAQPAQIPPRAA